MIPISRRLLAGPVLGRARAARARSLTSIPPPPAAAAAAPAPASRRLVQALAATLRGGAADVEDLALTFGLSPAASAPLARAGVRPLCVVKVGGEVITKDLPALVASLQAQIALGLFPVVVHGGGPQLNDELARAGVSPEYIGGHRVTDAATMAVAKRVFEAANGELARALEAAGVPTQRFLGGVFGAEVRDERLGLVGEVQRVAHAGVDAAIAAGRVPVLTSLGLSGAGATLNINADVAARELAVALRPLKVVFISAGGGWREEGRVVDEIDMARDFARMEARDYTGRQGTLLKLREVKLITDRLPAASSVTIASASALAAQLLPHRGPGTHIRRGQRINRFASLGALDATRLDALLRVCGAPRPAAGADIVAVYVTDEYSACAIVSRPPQTSASGGPPPLPLLQTMVCQPLAVAEGVERALWAALREDFTALAWLAPPSRETSAALAEVEARGADHAAAAFPPLSFNRSLRHASGGVVPVGSGTAGAAMWYGAGAERAAEIVAAVHASAAVPPPPPPPPPAGSAASAASVAAPTGASARDIRVGLLGARGFVGRELLRLVARHPRLQVVCASSRALVGQDVAGALGVPEARDACAPGLAFVDVGPAELASGAHAPVDAWVLALPNGLAAAHADAVEARARALGAPAPLLVDLSADMRFTERWTYGLPERKGARERLRVARRIANPGCYATGAQVALMPLVVGVGAELGLALEWDPAQRPCVFGVSGYSGAGTTPSDKNDPTRLRDNLLPYALVGHLHEREIATHCGLLRQPGGLGVGFMPHVAPFFQGISLTVTGQLRSAGGGGWRSGAATAADLQRHFERFYAGERLVRVSRGMPDVREHEERFAHGVTVGGFTLDAASGRLALVACIDNLLKGAATQAVQNINLACGLDEFAGIPVPPLAS